MNGTFNGQILVDKLAKLNNSQQSIETLSHWCIFHRKNAKQVVETWAQRFHCSPKDQRVSFLYLANDVLQNSRRKGLEFVTEFWKVLPDALKDVIQNGDQFGKNAALRLIDIWEDRKVFLPRGQSLREEILGVNLEDKNRNGKGLNYKLKQTVGDMLEKLISSFYDSSVDEDALFGKCRTAISSLEKVEKEIGSDSKLGTQSGCGVVEELQEQHHMLKECIEQLKAVESSRTILVSHLREVLHEQEFKIGQVRNQLEVAQIQYEQVSNSCQKLLGSSVSQSRSVQRSKEASDSSDAPPGFTPGASAVTEVKEQSIPVGYLPQGPLMNNPPNTVGHRKTLAVDMSAQLTSSTSTQVVNYVPTSLTSDGGVGMTGKEGYTYENKRPKLDNGVPLYVPPEPQPAPPPYPHPDTLHQPPPPPPLPPSPPMVHPSPMKEAPPPLPPTVPPVPLVPPLLPPTTTPLNPFMQAGGPMTGAPYGYGSPPLQRPAPPLALPMPAYPMVGMPSYPAPPNPYYGFQAYEGSGFFGQQPMSAPPPPMPQQ